MSHQNGRGYVNVKNVCSNVSMKERLTHTVSQKGEPGLALIYRAYLMDEPCMEQGNQIHTRA